MRIQRHLIVIAALIFGLSAWIGRESHAAENENPAHHAQGYAFFAPGLFVDHGHSFGLRHIGGGGEFLIHKGIAISPEVGYLCSLRKWGAGIGVLSVNGSYHFNRDRKLSPFITGGYSLAIGEGGYANLVNFGGGVHYWFHDRIGLRLEFRDHLDRAADQFLSGRIGISFR